jgi:glutaredoxin
MLKTHHVAGTNKKHKVMLYALSTCGWCAKTKALLGELGAEFDYIDVDLASESEQNEIMKIVDKVNPEGGFPTILIGETCIVGFKPEEIEAALK